MKLNPTSQFNKLKRVAKELPQVVIDAVKLTIAYILSRFILLLCNTSDDIWIIGERQDEARDNGYHLFRYIREHHKDIEVYYLLSRNSPDYGKILAIGPVIRWDSFKHYLYWCLADRIISAHDGKLAPGGLFCYFLAKKGFNNNKSIFLGHGVTAITMPNVCMKSNESHRLIVASSKIEKKFLVETGRHDQSEVQVLGLCRFDRLYGIPRGINRQILFMPTWRRWLRTSAFNDFTVAQKEFVKSYYYKSIHQFLSSEKLHQLLEDNSCKLVFFPHYQMQSYLDLFFINSSYVKIADRVRFDVQQLLIESSLLVSDYSSVSFDFAYMKKPVLYFLPDEEQFFKYHARKGYFDLEKDGFGPVARDANELVVEMEKIIDNDFVINLEYMQRLENFFEFFDDKNCERTMEAIRSLGK